MSDANKYSVPNKTSDQYLVGLRDAIDNQRRDHAAREGNAELVKALDELYAKLKDDIDQKITLNVADKTINKCAAMIIATHTINMLPKLNAISVDGKNKESAVHKLMQEYLENCAQTSGYIKFVRVLIVVAAMCIGFILGVCLGIGIGMLAGVWSGPGALFTGFAGAVAGSVAGFKAAAAGLVIGASVAGVVAGYLSTNTFSFFRKHKFANEVDHIANHLKTAHKPPVSAAKKAR